MITGAKSEDLAWTAAKKFAKIVSKATGITISAKDQELDFKIQNIVASHSVGFEINLEKVRLRATEFC